MPRISDLHRLGCATALTVAASWPVVAQNAAPNVPSGNAQQSAYRSSVAEESVRKQTDKIQGEINELVAELKLNGLDNADLAILSDASDHLKDLSQQDMQKVITALQNASLATQDQDRQKSLVSAYQNQQSVSLKLKSLAADIASQQSQKEIPSKLEILIARQSANIRQTNSLGSSTPDQLSAPLKSTHDVASSEQTSIGGEIDLFAKVLAVKPDAPPVPGTPDIAKAVLDAMNGGTLKDVSASATQLTSSGPFPDAVTKQKAVREALTSLLRTALSNVDAVTRLEDVKAQLLQILTDQKDLGDVTQQAKLDGATLSERQAKIGDRTAVAGALLKSVNPTASGSLDQAQDAMGQSSDALAKAKNPAETAPQQKVVVDDLEKTEAMLDQQIADAQKEQAMSPADKLAALQQLQSQIDSAEKNPQTSASDLQKMQQSASALSPQAANKIADAADQLQKPQPDQAAANQALAQASTDVQQQQKDMTQAAQAYQALANASQQLTQAQQDAAAANQAIQNSPANLTQAAHDLTQAQAALDQAQQATQQANQQSAQQNSQQTAQQNNQQQAGQQQQQSGSPTDAQQAMQQASDALKDATNQAVQAQGANAQAQDQKAMAAMQKAQAGLAQAMAQMQQQGQGQGQGKGQGQMAQQGQGQGKPQPGQKNGKSTQAQATDSPQDENGNVLAGYGGDGVAQVMGGLKQRDRDAISQYQAEKAPPEYAPMVQQYLKNLADSSESETK